MICLKTPLHLSQFLQAIEAPVRPMLFYSDTANNVTLPQQMYSQQWKGFAIQYIPPT